MEKFSKQQKFEAIFREASAPQKRSDCFLNTNFSPQPFLSNFSSSQRDNRPKEKNPQIFFIENHLETNVYDQKQTEASEKAQNLKKIYLRTISANRINVFDRNYNSKKLGKH